MNLGLGDISAYSVLVPTIIGLVRFPRVYTEYFPFLLMILAGFITELLCEVLIELNQNYNLVINIYTLVQACLVTWQFDKWKLFKKNRMVFWGLLISFTVFWFVENEYLGYGMGINSFFIIFSSYIMTLMSINVINKLVVKVHGSLWKNESFLICLGWLVYFTYSVISEAFFKYGLIEGKPLFAVRVYAILQYINIFSNFVYAFAIIWMPSKPKFILPS